MQTCSSSKLLRAAGNGVQVEFLPLLWQPISYHTRYVKPGQVSTDGNVLVWLQAESLSIWPRFQRIVLYGQEPNYIQCVMCVSVCVCVCVCVSGFYCMPVFSVSRLQTTVNMRFLLLGWSLARTGLCPGGGEILSYTLVDTNRGFPTTYKYQQDLNAGSDSITAYRA